MNTSEQIDKLSPALVLARSQMGGAKKDAVNPFFKSSYSDLTSVMQAVSIPFADNDLCFIQGAEFIDGRIAVSTRLIHKSGQWIESTIELPAVKSDPQSYGSAVTYAKRYGLQAMAGVPSIDDDAQYASAAIVESKKDNESKIQSDLNNCKSLADLALWWGGLDKFNQAKFSTSKDQAKKRLTGE